MDITSSFQGTDIYLIDQILKGTYLKEHKILDAGCGIGRNMRWFAINKFQIEGCDSNAEALQEAIFNTQLNPQNFKVSSIEKMPYEAASFNHIICNAVLHFSASEKQFFEMVTSMHKALKVNGTLFIRMTSTFGLPKNYEALGSGRYLLADESERFLLTPELLKKIKNEFNFVQLEPIKSVLVENLRSMTTLILLKT